MIDKAALLWSDGAGFFMSYPGDEGENPMLPSEVVFLTGLCLRITIDPAFVQEQIDWNLKHLPPEEEG